MIGRCCPEWFTYLHKPHVLAPGRGMPTCSHTKPAPTPSTVTATYKNSSEMHLNHPPEQNGRHFADDIFRCIFVNVFFVFWSNNFSEACSWASNWQQRSIGLDKCLGTEEATSHYLKNADPILTHKYGTSGKWVKLKSDEISFNHNPLLSCQFVL